MKQVMRFSYRVIRLTPSLSGHERQEWQCEYSAQCGNASVTSSRDIHCATHGNHARSWCICATLGGNPIPAGRALFTIAIPRPVSLHARRPRHPFPHDQERVFGAAHVFPFTVAPRTSNTFRTAVTSSSASVPSPSSIGRPAALRRK